MPAGFLLGVVLAVWALTAVSVQLLTRSERRGLRIAAWAVPLVWPPLPWGAAIGLFLLFPTLGGA